MTPALIASILALVEQAIANEPQIAAALKDIFSKQNATPEDWQAVKDNILTLRYQDLVPNTQLPKA